MCELFGFSGEERQNITDDLKAFFSHSVTNPNGWGLAGFDGAHASVYTEPLPAYESAQLPQLLQKERAAKTVLAHIRKATVGGIAPDNCHPFVRSDRSGRVWTLIHNGTIFSGLELIPYQKKQRGDTDSERILLYLVDQINEEAAKQSGDLNAFERFRVIDGVVAKLSYRNKLNLLLFDGEQLYVHVNMKDTLFSKTDEKGLMIATVPLGQEGWTPLPLTTLLVYRDGTLIYKGKNHHNEYIDMIDVALQQFEYQI